MWAKVTGNHVLCHENLESLRGKVTGSHGLRSKSRNHEPSGQKGQETMVLIHHTSRDFLPKKTSRFCWEHPLAAPPFLSGPLHITSSFRHGSKLLADEWDGLTISSSKALQLLTAAPHFYMLLKFHEVLIFAEDITMVVCLWYTHWCLLFHHPICVHVLGISTATCCLRTP